MSNNRELIWKSLTMWYGLSSFLTTFGQTKFFLSSVLQIFCPIWSDHRSTVTGGSSFLANIHENTSGLVNLVTFVSIDCPVQLTGLVLDKQFIVGRSLISSPEQFRSRWVGRETLQFGDEHRWPCDMIYRLHTSKDARLIQFEAPNEFPWITISYRNE